MEERTPWMAARRITVCAGRGAAGAEAGGATAGAAVEKGRVGAWRSNPPPAVGAVGVAVGGAAAAVVAAGADDGDAAPAILLMSERRMHAPSVTVNGWIGAMCVGMGG